MCIVYCVHCLFCALFILCEVVYCDLLRDILAYVYFSTRVIIALESCHSIEYLITSFNELKFVTRFSKVIVTFVTPHPSLGGRHFCQITGGGHG